MTETSLADQLYSIILTHDKSGYVSDVEREAVFSKVQERLPHVDRAGFDAALESIDRLRSSAYDIGERIHDKLIDQDRGLAELKQAFPEFDENNLRWALGQGLFAAMR